MKAQAALRLTLATAGGVAFGFAIGESAIRTAVNIVAGMAAWVALMWVVVGYFRKD